MVRIAGVVIPGYPHHIPQRGVRPMDTFSSDECRKQYLQFMKEFTISAMISLAG